LISKLEKSEFSPANCALLLHSAIRNSANTAKNISLDKLELDRFYEMKFDEDAPENGCRE
jgi:hypothetical protein